MRTNVFLDRSRIKDRQGCPTYRYLHYDKKLPDNPEASGLQKPIPARHFGVGLVVHKGLEILLKTGDIGKATGEEVDALLFEYFPYDNDRKEAEYLCKGLIYGWYRERYPAIMRDYHILETEKTYQWQIAEDAQYLYYYNFRVDALLERKDDARITILDFKTSKKCDDEWARMFEHDLQPILYTTAIDELLGVDCLGMLFEGLVKGETRIDTAKSSPFHGQWIQYSPLCYGYKTDNGYQLDYLKGAEKIRVSDHFSVEEWYDHFVIPQLNTSLFVHVPPIKPTPIVAQNIIQSIIFAETTYHSTLSRINQIASDYPTLLPYIEAREIEKNTSHCWKYGKEYQCQFYDICWTQGVSEDPLSHGYIPRVHNHAEEVNS